MKSSSTSRRLLPLSVDVDIPVALPYIRRGSPFFLDTLQRSALDLVGAVPLISQADLDRAFARSSNLSGPQTASTAIGVCLCALLFVLIQALFIASSQGVVAILPPWNPTPDQRRSFLIPAPCRAASIDAADSSNGWSQRQYYPVTSVLLCPSARALSTGGYPATTQPSAVPLAG